MELRVTHHPMCSFQVLLGGGRPVASSRSDPQLPPREKPKDPRPPLQDALGNRRERSRPERRGEKTTNCASFGRDQTPASQARPGQGRGSLSSRELLGPSPRVKSKQSRAPLPRPDPTRGFVRHPAVPRGGGAGSRGTAPPGAALIGPRRGQQRVRHAPAGPRT